MASTFAHRPGKKNKSKYSGRKHRYLKDVIKMGLRGIRYAWTGYNWFRIRISGELL
jgi:hypothetical protein